MPYGKRRPVALRSVSHEALYTALTFFSAIEVFLNGMRYINPRFTYLLFTYFTLLTYPDECRL